MYEIQFLKENGGTGRVYVWGCNLGKAKLHLQECGHNITKINQCKIFEWLYYAYIKEPYRRYKKWWNW